MAKGPVAHHIAHTSLLAAAMVTHQQLDHADAPHALFLRRLVPRRRQDSLGERMVHDLSEAVGPVVKGVAMDRRRLLGREQAWRHQGAPNDFHLLLCCARLFHLLGLRHELLGGGIAREAETARKLQSNGGALVWSHLLVEGQRRRLGRKLLAGCRSWCRSLRGPLVVRSAGPPLQSAFHRAQSPLDVVVLEAVRRQGVLSLAMQVSAAWSHATPKRDSVYLVGVNAACSCPTAHHRPP